MATEALHRRPNGLFDFLANFIAFFTSGLTDHSAGGSAGWAEICAAND